MVISSNLLSAWYGAQNATALSRTTAFSQSASNAQNPNRSSSSDVLPPWDARGEIEALDVLKRSALADGVFFDKKLGDFASLDVGEDEKQLFAMYQGLRRLQALGSEAAEKGTLDSRRDFLDRRFQEGLNQLNSFFGDLSLEGVTVLKGEELSKAESSLAISRGISEYVTPIVHSGAFDAEVDGFQGDVIVLYGDTPFISGDTLQALRHALPRIGFVWLMGADNLAQLPRWQRWEEAWRR